MAGRSSSFLLPTGTRAGKCGATCLLLSLLPQGDVWEKLCQSRGSGWVDSGTQEQGSSLEVREEKKCI